METEFMYRAGDVRRGKSSPSPPTPSPSAPGAAAAAADGHQQPVVGGHAADETHRQAEKARILERILREETVDRFELELEVRLELHHRFRRQGCLLKAAGGPLPKANSEATKRKSPASNASVGTGSKKQKLISLSCTVCGSTATSEKAWQDHLSGKKHKRKVATLAAKPATEPPQPAPEPEEAEEEEADTVVMGSSEPSSDDFKPMKFMMVTKEGNLYQATQMDGYLLCEVCNVRTSDRVTMMCHFEGTKHISKAEKATCQDAAGEQSEKCGKAAPTAVASAAVKGTAQAQVMTEKDDTAPVNEETASQIEAPLVKPAVQGKVGDDDIKKDVVAVEASKSRGKEAAKVSTGSAPTFMEVDGVRHPLQRVDGNNLLCPCCDVKAPSDAVMRSHLIGKKHKKKMTSATEACVGGKGVGSLTVTITDTTTKIGGKEDSSEPATKMNTKNAAAADVAPMEESDALPETIDVVTSIELAADDAPKESSDAATPESEAAGDTSEPAAGKPVTVCVEGKMFTVQSQEDGKLSCELCGVRGCNKDAMLKHLYTRTHWDKACRLAEKEMLARAADEAPLVKDGSGGSPSSEGMAQVRTDYNSGD